MTYEVGKFYRVPCIKTTKSCSWGNGEYVPIIGPEHTDAELIKFPHLHWHINWQFASANVVKRRGTYSHYSCVIQRWAWGDPKFNQPLIEGDVVAKRLKCKREWPAYPHAKAQWLLELDTAFSNTKMRGMVCPHRGLPLENCARDGDVVQCPGHGLRWNVKTGELVR